VGRCETEKGCVDPTLFENETESQGSKYFFFEKKKQKTFARWLTRTIRPART
jgi:hypothetical protein